MALSQVEASRSFLGLLPFAILLVAAAAIGFLSFSGKLTGDDVGIVIFRFIMIGVCVILVLVVVGSVCLNIHPTEQFLDPLDQLWADLAVAEKDVCGFFDRADGFIQNDIGKPGHDDPSLVTNARLAARNKAGPIVDCTHSWVDVSANEADAADRIGRLEASLSGFTGPVFQKAFKQSDTCGFLDASLTARFTAVQQQIVLQKSKYLKPIDDKTAALNRGEVSDCDKSKGATAGAGVAGGKMPA